MSALSDGDIWLAQAAKDLDIEPWNEERIKPNSVDLTLGRQFMYFDRDRILNQHLAGYPYGNEFVVDPYDLPTDLYSEHHVGPNSKLILKEHSFMLGVTVEKVTLSAKLCGRLEGKSSLARLGLAIHSTAGFIDAGFSGQITLELFNFSPLPILLHPGMPIAQIFFEWLATPAERPYGEHQNSKYQNSEGVIGSRFDRNVRP